MAAGSESPNSSSKNKKCLKKWCQLDNFILVLVIAFFFSLLAFPVLYYVIVDLSGRTNSTVEDQLFSNQCSAAILYNGSVCHDILMQYVMECDQNILQHSVVHVINENLAEVEKLVTDMAGILSAECFEEATSFFCLYLLKGICLDNGVQILPTSEDCLKVKFSCQELQGSLPWQGVGEIDCNSLPLLSSPCKQESTVEPLVVFTNPDPLHTNSCTLNCRENFFCDNMTCVPHCPGFTFYSATATIISNVLIIVSSSIGLLTGIAVLIISVIRRKIIFTFPSILAVYETLTFMLNGKSRCVNSLVEVMLSAADIIQIIAFMDRKALYCTSPNLLETLNNIPPFCVLTGLVLVVYIPLQFNIWWVTHMLVLYLGVRFPLKFKTPASKRRLRVVHIVVVIIGLLAPLIPIVVLIAESMVRDDQLNSEVGIRYGPPPPILCAVESVLSFFFLIYLPINTLTISGCIILALLIWTVHKKFGIIKTIKSSSTAPLSTTEVKLLMVIIYFIIAEILFFISAAQNKGSLDFLDEYFECEAPGVDPDKPCSRALFENDQGHYVFSFFYSLILMIPAVCLVFVVDCSQIKKKIETIHLTASTNFTTSNKL